MRNFCPSCGPAPHDLDAAFCARCGSSLTPSACVRSSLGSANTAQVESAPPAYQSEADETLPIQSHHQRTFEASGFGPRRSQSQTLPPSNVESATQLFDALGQRTANFDSLARAIFNAIDGTVSPRNTGWWEQRKMEAFKKACGGYVAKDYDRVLRIAYETIGCATETVQGRQFLTQAGFATFLEYKIKMNPEQFYHSLRAVLDTFAVDSPKLKRIHLPAGKDPVAEVQAQQIIDVLAEERRNQPQPTSLSGKLKRILNMKVSPK